MLDESARTNPSRAEFTKRALAAALESLDTSNRQYVGFYATQDSQRVVINVFPSTNHDPFVHDWRSNLVGGITDGGFEFWHIQYDVNRREFIEFELS